jgi:hypothetical protein
MQALSDFEHEDERTASFATGSRLTGCDLQKRCEVSPRVKRVA